MGPASDENLGRQPHMATATHSMVDAHDDILAFAANETLVAVQGGLIDGRGQFAAVGFKRGQFLLQIRFPFGKLLNLVLEEFLRFIGRLGRPADFLVSGLALLHDFDFPVFDFKNRLFAGFDFVSQGAIFLVLAGLELLVGVAFDLLLPGFDFQFQRFSARFKFLDLVLGGVELSLRPGSPGLEHLTLRLNPGEFPLQLSDLPVPVLKNQELFNNIQHVSISQSIRRASTSQ